MGRKLLGLVIGAVVVLAGLAAAYSKLAFCRMLEHPKQASHGAGKMMTTERSIRSVCRPTIYRETCVRSLEAAAGSTTDPKELVKLGFQLARQSVADAVAKSATVKAGRDDPRSAQALHICTEVMSYAMHELEKTVKSAAGELNKINNLSQFTEDLKVWVGSAATFQDVCFDAFENATRPAPAATLRHLFATSRQLTSNSLAMIDELRMVVSLLNISSSSSSSSSAPALPLWLTHPKRHILDRPVAALTPHAVVALDGTAKFKTITDALATVPPHTTNPFLVYVKAGVYNEQVTVHPFMKNVVIIGDGATKTVITGNLSFADGTQTYNTATFAAMGEGLMMRDIGIKNTAGPGKRQAVAVRVSGDYSVFHRCRFSGYQATLYVVSGRQFYQECTISGSLDFIWGDALALFQNCKALIRKPLEDQQCVVTAQARNEPHGPGAIVLQNCTVTGDRGYRAVKDSSPAFLGRPGKPFSRTVVMQSYIGDCISPAGWAPWAGTMGLSTLFYAEYGNRGPGSVKKGRVAWKGIKKLRPEEVTDFTADRFLLGSLWVTPTGTPYSGAFMNA